MSNEQEAKNNVQPEEKPDEALTSEELDQVAGGTFTGGVTQPTLPAVSPQSSIYLKIDYKEYKE